MPSAAAPEGSERYFKVHLTLEDEARGARAAQELQYYFNFEMRQHLWLTNGRDSINPDIYFHESAQGLSPKNSFFIGFPDDLVPGGTLALAGPLAGEYSFPIDPRSRS